MLQLLIFSVLIVVSRIQVDSFSVPVVSDIQDIIGLANDVQDIFSGNIPFKNLIVKPVDNTAVALQKIDALSQQVSQLANDVSEKMNEILTVILERIPLAQDISAAMNDFQKQIVRVDSLFDDFQDLISSNGTHNDFTLNKFLNAVTSSNAGDLQDVLDQMHALFVPQRAATIRDSLMKLMIRARNASLPAELCNPAFSFQERLYEIFNIVIVTEMRGYIMTLFAYDTLAKRSNSSFVREIQKTKAKYVLRSEEYILTTQKKMAAASRELYRCDPSEYISGETYVEMEGLFTGFLMLESQGFSDHTCSNTCADIDTTKVYRCGVWDGGNARIFFCHSRVCFGRMYWCQTLDSTTACEYPANVTKRYKWLHTDNGDYGPVKEPCKDGEEKYVRNVKQVFEKCEPCLCRCVELFAKSPATRAINLTPQLSDIYENKVVSNVRFTSKDKMIHLQIEESPLLPSAHVNLNDSSWVPLNNYKYVPTEPYGEFVKVENGKDLHLTLHEDYTFLTDNRRSFNFDEILLPQGYVLTGVRMNFENRNNIKNAAIQIEAHATPIDFGTGELVPTNVKPSIWITPKSQPNPHIRYTKKRTEVDYGKKIDPRKSKKNLPFSKVNEFILFGPSNAKDDAAQTTIPLFDAQPVAVNRTLALSGIGVFDRSAKDYAGFITPKLFNIDLSQYMNTVLQKKQLKAFKKLYREPLAYDPPLKK